jgi:hypothetical protein
MGTFDARACHALAKASTTAMAVMAPRVAFMLLGAGLLCLCLCWVSLNVERVDVQRQRPSVSCVGCASYGHFWAACDGFQMPRGSAPLADVMQNYLIELCVTQV